LLLLLLSLIVAVVLVAIQWVVRKIRRAAASKDIDTMAY
jgi:hypothetical protein